jgi:hypothetical protein
MEQTGEKGIGLEIEGGRIHFRVGGMKAPRSMPYADCTGVALYMMPTVGALGMTKRYRVELMSSSGGQPIPIGDTPNLGEARDLWRRTAGELEKPALMVTPDGRKADSAPSDPPPAGIRLSEQDGRIHVAVHRSRLEYIFAAVLVLGLGIALVFGEPKQDDAVFMVVAAGLMAYAVIAGLSSHFIEISDGTLRAGLRTPLGVFAKVEMPLKDVEIVLWGTSARGWGRIRSAFAMASPHQTKSFDRLPEDQASWLTRFVRQAVRG